MNSNQLIQLILFLFLVSCVQEKNKNAEVCSYPAIPETHVKMSLGNKIVDSLITIKPISEYDTLQFISVYYDSVSENLQKEIYALKKISIRTKNKIRIINFWFTHLVNQTDSTKDFGLFAVRKGDHAAEMERFRFNNKNEITGVNNNPLLFKDFTPIEEWRIDTIQYTD